MTSERYDTKKLTVLALLTAIVVVLQFAGSFIRFGMFAICPVLIPIVIGAALYGPLAGAWLGLAFSLTVLISGDAAAFLAVDVFGTIVTVLVKGVGAGFGAGLAYKLLCKRATCADCSALEGFKGNDTAAAFAAAVVSPVINTGIFLIGCLLFFMDTITEWALAFGFASAGSYMILGLAGGNFLFELALNLVLCPVIVRLVKLRGKMVRKF